MENKLEKKELSIKSASILVFIPTLILTSVYAIIGVHWQGLRQ